MIQDNERDALCRMFCAFCRRTLLNARTDVLRSKSRSARRELPFSQMPESELRRLAAPWEGMEPEVVFSANGHLIGVADEWVASALAGLPERESIQTVVLAILAGMTLAGCCAAYGIRAKRSKSDPESGDGSEE